MKIHIPFYLIVLLSFAGFSCKHDKSTSLFNGKDLKNWTAKGAPFEIAGNAIVTPAEEGFIFYSGSKNQFKNFDLTCDVKTEKGGAAEILFHTGTPRENEVPAGYAVKIKNTYDAVPGESLKLTGSINRIRNVYFPFVGDDVWFKLGIGVENNKISVFINGKLVQEYTQPENAWRPDDLKARILSQGTIGIHSISGKVEIKNIEISEKETVSVANTAVDHEYDKMITSLHASDFPLIDFHVHIKGGLTMEEILAISREKGINYGVAANCGLHFPVTNNTELNQYLKTIEGEPIFKAMQAEGREWMTLFSPDTAASFDYIFTDAMTWTNSKGRRLRLWIKEETEVGDPQKFMEELVGKIEQIVTEPIDIYVNPTFIPEEIQSRYNELWTEKRMDRVIQALAKNNVAFEINSRYKIPSVAFIKKAKAAGVKFTFGTNNTGRDDLDYAYCFQVLNEVGLTPADMWMPRIPGEKKIQKSL